MAAGSVSFPGVEMGGSGSGIQCVIGTRGVPVNQQTHPGPQSSFCHQRCALQEAGRPTARLFVPAHVTKTGEPSLGAVLIRRQPSFIVSSPFPIWLRNVLARDHP